MSLAALQAAFFNGIVEGAGPELIARLRAPPRGDADQRFAIYREGFGLRMREFLGADYPALRALIGEDAFGGMVEAYGRQYPSGFRNARWVGAALPRFLREDPDFADRLLWADLAALEAALLENFDCADVLALSLADLAEVAPDQVGGLRFEFPPTMALLRLRGAAIAAFERFRDGSSGTEEAAENAIDARDEACGEWLVWRRDFDVLYRALEPDEAAALRLARDGARFEQICAALGGEGCEAVAAGFLARWFDDRIIVAAKRD